MGAAVVTGSHNTAVGYRAAQVLTTGNYGVFVGKGAGYNVTTASSVTIVGYNAAYGLTTGNENVILGNSACSHSGSTTHNSNVVIGCDSVQGQAFTGSGNVVIGRQAGYHMSSADYNVVIGMNSGDAATFSGNKNVILGYGNDLDTGARAGVVILGHEMGPIASDNTFRVMGANGVYHTGNTTTWSTVSDRRIKKDIVDNNQGLDIINRIRVRNFNYRTEAEIDAPELQQYPVKDIVVDKPGLQIGAIAQEFEEILPDSIVTTDWGVKNINTDPLIWHLVNAVKELSARVQELESRQ